MIEIIFIAINLVIEFQVRIEDDIVVTKTGMECMTKVPRTVAEIEALMAEGSKLEVHFPQQKFNK